MMDDPPLLKYARAAGDVSASHLSGEWAMRMRSFATGFVAVTALIVAPRHVRAAIFDTFSDGNDTANPAWSHLAGYVNSTGQTWDASSGGYRLTAPNNGLQ